MPVRPICTIPNPVLQRVAAEIDTIAPEIQAIIADLRDTVRSHPHCVGIAAPQIGASWRIIIVDITRNPKPHHNHGELILINPVITASSGKHIGKEGCLSVPDLIGTVRRAEKITLKALLPNGSVTTFSTNGFEAVALQHEIDHLDGIVFLDRVSSLKTDVFRRNA